MAAPLSGTTLTDPVANHTLNKGAVTQLNTTDASATANTSRVTNSKP